MFRTRRWWPHAHKPPLRIPPSFLPPLHLLSSFSLRNPKILQLILTISVPLNSNTFSTGIEEGMSSGNHPTPILNKVNMPVETSPDRSQKNQKKVPKKIHKAEREKMKREHLNELFLALANALEVSEQTNGKACVLTEAARIVKDMGNQIECLRRDNAALLSESNYVATENKELQDENAALEVQIAKLRNELKERVADREIDLNQAPPEYQQQELAPEQMDGCFRYPVTGGTFQQAQNVNTLYVIPICSNPSTLMDSPNMALDASAPASAVSKPHPRYPNPGDIWPSQLLEKYP